MPERQTSDPHSVVITCEHGGNRIPARYRQRFAQARESLQSHRGYDPGALELARSLSKKLSSPLHFETVSRLLIEMNRSLDHPRLFSEFTKPLPEPERIRLIETIYLPYRTGVEQSVARAVRAGSCLHLSVHSFTPIWNGKTRPTDIGLLFDPHRSFETAVCHVWRRILRRVLPQLKIHFNLPYRGTSDGFTTALRQKWPDDQYAGIEIEVNQKFPLGPKPEWQSMINRLTESARELLRLLNGKTGS